MRAFSLLVLFVLGLGSSSARAEWRISSDFLVHFAPVTLQQMLESFAARFASQPQETVLGDVSLSVADTQVQVQGLRVRWSSALDAKPGAAPYVWKLASRRLHALTTVDRLVIRQHQTRVIEGINVGLDVTVECRNLELELPPASGAQLTAAAEALVSDGRIQFRLSGLRSRWPANAWRVRALDCPRLADIQGQVQGEIARNLAGLSSADPLLAAFLQDRIDKFVARANDYLLAPREVPTKDQHLKISQDARGIAVDGLGGISLVGQLHFTYPALQGKAPVQLTLAPDERKTNPAQSQVLVPFALVRALLAGEFESGQAKQTVLTDKVPAFAKLMRSRLLQLFVWPDLWGYDRDTVFKVVISPFAAPDCAREKAAGAGTVACDFHVPMRAQFFAPGDATDWEPYVEFRADLSGSADFRLDPRRGVLARFRTHVSPIRYAFSPGYLEKYDPPTYIGVKRFTDAANQELGVQSLKIEFPSLPFSEENRLAPQRWSLLPGTHALAIDLALVPAR